MHPGINLDSTPLMRKNSAELLNNCTFSHIEYVNFPTQEFSPLPRFRGVCLHSSFIHTFSRQFVLFPLMTSVFLLNGCSRFSMQTDFVAGSTSSFDAFLDDFSGRRSPPTRSIFIFHCPIRKTTALQRLRSRSAVSRKKHLPHPMHLWRTRSRLWQNTTAMPFRPPVSSPMTSCRIILRRSSPHPI